MATSPRPTPSGLETIFGRHSTVHCEPEEFSDTGKENASFGALTFPVHLLVLMLVINAGSSPVKVGLKQSAVTPGLLRYFKDVKTKMIIKTRIVNTTEDRLFLRIFNNQLLGLCHCTQTGEKQMSLKEMRRTFDDGHVVVAKVFVLDPTKDAVLSYINTKAFGDVQLYDHEEHDHSG